MKKGMKMLGSSKIVSSRRRLLSSFWLCILIIASAIAVRNAAHHESVDVQNRKTEGGDCTDLARDEETLMVFSTLGGGLTAIDPVTSEVRWTIADDPPIVAEQQQNENIQVPQYLPDPRDGSIYQLGDMGSLKKLPYTIPQLVANAPCRSSDGILYSGKKSDTWYIVDPKSGRREKVMGFGGQMEQTNNVGEKIGWATSRSIYLGRTQYTVMMYDSLAKNKNAKPWNITFYDYSSVLASPEVTNEYEYIHLTSTSSGYILTLDRKTGNFLWKRDLTSPVVSAFLLGPDGLLTVPFTTVSEQAFEAILEESKHGNVNTIKLFSSLYVGEHRHGLYALPSLIDKNTPRIATTPSIQLLDGPETNGEVDPTTIYINNFIQNNAGIVIGHYNMPLNNENNNLQISPSPASSAGSKDNHGLATLHKYSDFGYTIIPASKDKSSADIGVQTDPIKEITIEANAFNKTKKIIIANSNKIQKLFNEWFLDHPSSKVHQILFVIILAMLAMFWYMYSSMRELKNQSENGSKTYNNSGKISGGSNVSTQDLIDLGDGHVRVGKISFNSNEVLGKGCEGTFVFKGSFEERYVAVKRLLPECFTFADREVALLRESDAHENVVRYFCTEQDRQFRYIAVELCAATLQDYIEGENSLNLQSHINVWDVLKQSVAGLNHLHSLQIVHRDIKPQNVLLSLPDVNGNVRVMISDFGLCKKLNYGKASFSRRSGITGTDGWIAPEMMRAQRTTTSVDIFSLGCVYYYVLSGGHHAFGDALKRQANILSNEFNLSKLRRESEPERSKIVLAEQLIADMIHKDPQSRPPARSIGNHPIFWSDKKILSFLQDVSDRVEKLQFQVEPLKSLEKNGRIAVLDDWNIHLEPQITEDLRKYRGYMGASVRDLLRALRNKKHHYHELSQHVQEILGSIPHEFTNYWISKFPKLISHVYHAFSICSKEPLFKPYYNADYQFTRPWYFDADDSLFPLLMNDPKPIQKPNASPKKGPLQNSYYKSRKGSYNFRKPMTNYNNDDGQTNNGFQTTGSLQPSPVAQSFGLGLQRNIEFQTNNDEDSSSYAVGSPNRKDNFNSNTRFRRNQKPQQLNRNYNNFNTTINQNNEKFEKINRIDRNDQHVKWSLPINTNDKDI